MRLRRHRARAGEVQPDMNVTPLVDVVLVLLIIFMVVAPRMDQDVPVELPGIHEIEAGELEMRHDHEAYKIYLETAFAWGLGDLDRRMPGGDNGHEFFARFDESIGMVRAGHAVVFSHGAAIRVWVAGRANNVPPAFAGEHDIQNTGVIELDGTLETGFTLLSWQGTPVGGSDLSDDTAEDPTGETLEEALDEDDATR